MDRSIAAVRTALEYLTKVAQENWPDIFTDTATEFYITGLMRTYSQPEHLSAIGNAMALNYDLWLMLAVLNDSEKLFNQFAHLILATLRSAEGAHIDLRVPTLAQQIARGEEELYKILWLSA